MPYCLYLGCKVTTNFRTNRQSYTLFCKIPSCWYFLFCYLFVPLHPKTLSEVANEIGLINILHICDYGTPYKNAEALYAYADYPASIINVPLKFSDGSTLNLKEAQQRFSRPVFGGLERQGVIAKGSIEEAKKAVDEVLENAASNFILGVDCTVPGETDWDKLRAVIDYAHTWRETHKK